MKRDQIVKAAKELNDVLGLDPAIDVSLPESALRLLVLEAGKLLEEGDVVSSDVRQVLDGFEADENVVGSEERGVEEMKPEKKGDSVAARKKKNEPASKTRGTGKMQLLKELVATGSMTQKEIVEKVMLAFPGSSKQGTVSALSHGKGKHGKSPFGKVIHVSAEGRLHFGHV
jgi:hypothetical protein